MSKCKPSCFSLSNHQSVLNVAFPSQARSGEHQGLVLLLWLYNVRPRSLVFRREIVSYS